MPYVSAVATALPNNYVSQECLSKALAVLWRRGGAKPEVCERLHKATRVAGRYLALPLAEYPELDSFDHSNAAWMQVAPDLGREAAQRALVLAGIAPQQIDHVF